jgi:hypothetical protein
MTSLNRIELFLNIGTTNMRLYDGLKKRTRTSFIGFGLKSALDGLGSARLVPDPAGFNEPPALVNDPPRL